MYAKSQPEMDVLYDHIAPRYNLMNSVLSLGADGYVRRKASGLLGEGAILDIGTGTGVSAIPMLKRSRRSFVIGIDRCAGMFARGYRGERYFPVRGDGRLLPLRDSVFDGAAAGFVVRPINGDRSVFAEVFRVLRPGSVFVIYDTLRPSPGIGGFLYRLMLRFYVPSAARLITGEVEPYRFLSDSINRGITGGEVARVLRESGFVEIEVKPCLFGAITMISAIKPCDVI